MATSTFPRHLEQAICPACYLTECIERTGQKGICPLRITYRLKLTAEQGKTLSEIARHWGYQPHHFLKMAEITAERNLIQVGAL
jgi:hypothetical protein